MTSRLWDLSANLQSICTAAIFQKGMAYDLIGLTDIPHTHQFPTSEGIVHGTSLESLSTVLREGLKTRSVRVGKHMAVAHRLVAAGQVADHLDDVKAIIDDPLLGPRRQA